MNACNCLQINMHTFWVRFLCTNWDTYYADFILLWMFSLVTSVWGKTEILWARPSLLSHCVNNTWTTISCCWIFIVCRQSKSNKFGTVFYTSFSFSLVHFTQILKFGKKYWWNNPALGPSQASYLMQSYHSTCNWTTKDD